MTFPLPFRPALNYKTSPRCFGANRSGGRRKHAACDLYAPIGTEIYAVEDGVVIRPEYHFYLGSYAIEVRHPSGVVRYGEISKAAKGLKLGSFVREGQLIGWVGRLTGLNISMLHFEMYKGTATGPLTNVRNQPYQRREDLIDPTEYLDRCHQRVIDTPKTLGLMPWMLES